MTETLSAELKGEFRRKIIGAIVAGVLAIIAAIGLAAWAIAKALPGKIGLVPSGSVVAFDLEGGCPTGWSDFQKGWGRFVIGAVAESDLGKIPGDFRDDAAAQKISPRPFGSPGGEERHVLTLKEMPAHVHDVQEMVLNNAVDGVDSKVVGSFEHRNLPRQTGSAGDGDPHNNMPPYIALYYCKKD